MFTLDQMSQASFRGIPFLIQKSNAAQGPKIITHEYINDSRRFDENLGKYKPTYNITGYITGDNYISNRDALIAALTNGSIGILTHPFYGIRFVTPLPHSIDEDINTIGTAVFNMIFQVSDPPALPGDSGDLFSKIQSGVNALDDTLQKVFSAGVFVSNIYPDSKIFLQSKLNSLVGQFNGFKQSFTSTTDSTDLNNQQTQFNNAILQNITNSALLAAELSALFEAANAINQDPTESGNAFVSLFPFGQKDAIFLPTNPDAIQKNTNLIIVNYIFASYALMYAYFNFTQAVFTDTHQLNSIIVILEAQYQNIINGRIMEADIVDVDEILDNDALDNLDNLRTIARKQFDKDAQSTPNIVSINEIIPTSVTILSYLYYDDVDHDEEIIALNSLADIEFISGTLNMVTQPPGDQFR